MSPDDTLFDDSYNADDTPFDPYAEDDDSSPSANLSALFDITDVNGEDLDYKSRQLNLVPLNQLVRTTTLSWIKHYNQLGRTLEPHDIAQRLLQLVNSVILELNPSLDKDFRLTALETLTCDQVALLMTHCSHVVRIRPEENVASDPDNDMLASYVSDPTDSNYGTYQISRTRLYQLMRQYVPGLPARSCEEVISIMYAELPRVTANSNPDLLPVGNGIFNYRTKELTPFDPAHIFLAKTKVPFNPQATNPIITNPDGTTWDILSWFQGLSDDDGVPELLWQIAGAIVRPRVRWRKCAWFYSTVGNNGKGTLCQLYRNLSGSAVSVSIPEFSKEFYLSRILRATAIITDENPVGVFIDHSQNFKATVTNDPITINIKNKEIVDFQPFMFMVQCVNERPQVKDKSDSIYRRILLIPFNKNFGPIENTAIKDDYLNRPDVLEFALKYVLCDLPDYYRLSEPDVVREELDDFKLDDPVRAFYHEVLPQFTWDFYPQPLLYQMYMAWYKKAYPSSQAAISDRRFYERSEHILANTSGWTYYRKQATSTTTPVVPEPLLEKYNLEDFMHSSITSFPNRAIWDTMPAKSRGLRRL